MAKQTINIGTVANDRSGDPLRTAFTKVNQNFTELYNRDASDFSGNYNDLTNKPNLNLYQLVSTAFSGDYEDLENAPAVPSDVSDLTDTTRIIEGKYSIIRKDYTVKNKAAGDIASGELIPQDFNSNYVSNTEDTRVLNFSTESSNNGSFSTLFESMIYNKQALEMFITDFQGNDEVFFTKEVDHIPTDSNSYRGFGASFATIYKGGRNSINQIVITTEDTNPTTSTSQDLDDDFEVSGINGSETVAVVTIFRGSDDPIGRGQLWEFFKEYVDVVLYTEETENSTATIKTRFYQNIESLKSKVPVLYPDFHFYSNTAITASSGIVTGGSGTGASFSLLPGRYEGESWRNGSLLNGGINYNVGNVLTISGTQLGGTSNNNVSILVSGVNGSGTIVAYTVSGTAVNVWPTSSILNGGAGQYDSTGNIINTNLSLEVDYNDGNRVPSSGTGNTAFGSASSYVTLYKDSIFSMVAKDADISSVYFSGTLGSDGDIQKSDGELEGVLGYEVMVGGLSVTGNWVANRTYAVSYSYAGYDLPRTPAGSITTTNVSNWNTAYSWGDHALAGYLTGAVSFTELEDIIPAEDLTYNIGSLSNYWSDLYVNTIFMKGDEFNDTSGSIRTDFSSILFAAIPANTVSVAANTGPFYAIGLFPTVDSGSEDHFIIVDAIRPNDIRIRAGGMEDDSESNLTIGGNNSYFRVESGLNPDLQVAANNYVWQFGGDGTLTLPAGGIITAPDDEFFKLQAKDTDSLLRNEINLDPNNGTYMSVWSGELDTAFSTDDWATASWQNNGGQGYAIITNAENLADFWTAGPGSIVNNIEVSINGGARTPVQYYGDNEEQYDVELLVTAIPGSTTEITSLIFYYQTKNSINIDYDGGEILLDGQTLNINLQTTNGLTLQSGQILDIKNIGQQPVRIFTDNTTHTWEFDSGGSLTLPREGRITGIGDGPAGNRYGYISWAGNSSGDGAGYNTMRLVPDSLGLEDADQYIILDPTSPGHIHIRAGGTQDNSQAILYFGGENSHVKINSGPNPPVTVMSANNSWTFGTDGGLQFPDTTEQTTAFTTSPTLNVLKIDDGVHEKFQTKADATGTVTHDCASGHVFYHTSPDANWTANFTNLNLNTGYVTAVSLVIVQGATGYYPNAVQIGGAAQTINWQGNATPTVSSSRTDVVTFSILNNAGTYTVLGQLTGF
jgi:hypothetical protein